MPPRRAALPDAASAAALSAEDGGAGRAAKHGGGGGGTGRVRRQTRRFLAAAVCGPGRGCWPAQARMHAAVKLITPVYAVSCHPACMAIKCRQAWHMQIQADTAGHCLSYLIAAGAVQGARAHLAAGRGGGLDSGSVCSVSDAAGSVAHPFAPPAPVTSAGAGAASPLRAPACAGPCMGSAGTVFCCSHTTTRVTALPRCNVRAACPALCAG